MEGAAKAEKKRFDLAFWGAWHTEAFARMEGRHFKRALADHFDRPELVTSDAVKNAQGIAFFHRLKARGVPVSITRH